MKRRIIILFIIVLVLSMLLLMCSIPQNTIDLKGQILLRMPEDDMLTIYDLSTKETKKLPLKRNPVFFGNDKILFADCNIYEYDLNTNELTTLYESEVDIDYITVRNNESVSFSKGNLIYLYDTQNDKSTAFIWDNGSEIHSWSDDGNTLYYSDVNKKIKAVDMNTNKVKEITQGFSPVANGLVIAYSMKNNGLVVKNLQTGTEYKYNGSPFNYLLSPDGKILLIEEQNMPFGTMVKNIITGNSNILGGCILAWDYENNLKKDVITDEYCYIYDWGK